MPQAATQTKDTTEAPLAPRLTRGLREGEIRTRAAANGAPAPTSYDVEARTFDFTLLTSRSCSSYPYVLTEGDRWPAYTRVEEKLDMAGAVGLDELVGSSVLNSHRCWDVESVIGVIESATVEGDALNCRARLSPRCRLRSGAYRDGPRSPRASRPGGRCRCSDRRPPAA